MNPLWSYVLGAVGIFGLWLAGRKDWRGWAVGLGAQFLWLAYAIATHQWGFIATALGYGLVNLRNLRAWMDALPKAGTCDRPRRGWFCTLDRGHDGPCPAYPRYRPMEEMTRG